jgi:pilus assembly protein CpaB
MSKFRILSRLNGPWVILAISLASALLVSWFAYIYLQQREHSLQQQAVSAARGHRRPDVVVVVPIEDSNVGAVLTKEKFVARPIEDDLVYPDTLLAADFDTYEGQKLAQPVLHGRPVRMSDLVVPAVKNVASIIPDGKRALTIEIDNLNSISHTVHAGDHVDLFLLSTVEKSSTAGSSAESGSGGDKGGQAQASLFMQDMLLIATGREFEDVVGHQTPNIEKMAQPGSINGREGEAKEYDTVTLLVSPIEAEKLLVGQRLGNFRIALRGKKDENPVNVKPLNGNDVMQQATGAHRSIEYIVGGKGEIKRNRMDVPTSGFTSRPSTVSAAAIQAAAQVTGSAQPLTDEQLNHAIWNRGSVTEPGATHVSGAGN